MATATDENDRKLSVVGDGDKNETVEEMADKEPETPPTQLAIPGTRDRLTGTFGGSLPTDSELRIMGGKRPIVGQFEKGERITVLSTGTIRAVEGSDTDDDWGTVSKTTRIHKMRQLHVQVATPPVLLRELIALGFDDKAKLGILFDEVTGE